MLQYWSLYFMWIMVLRVTYNCINRRNTFSNGDIVTGQVTLEIRKSCQINSLSITFEAQSRVEWDDGGSGGCTYRSTEKYFKMQRFFIGGYNLQANSVVAPGCYVYQFSFPIPSQDLPASYHSHFGHIEYILEARLSRSMKRDKKHATKINFVPRQDLTNNLAIMTPQCMAVKKKMNLFNSGRISMDVKLEKSGFFQGERLKVLAYIENNSSREIKPKYRLIRKQSYFAENSSHVQHEKVLKEVGEPIPRSTSQSVTKVITIPQGEISILNCPNIKVEYRLRVYLDVKFAFNPEINFPIIILKPQVPAVAPPPGVSHLGFGAFGSTRPPTWGLVPSTPLVVDLPPSYESHGLYPSLTDAGRK